MSWWQRLFSREKTAAAPQATLVRGVVMTMPGWHEDAPSGAMRTWHHPDGGVLSLAMASGGAIPPPSQLDLLRNAFRRLAEAAGAGLVEANAVESAHGPAARMIYKRRQGMAFVFTGMLLLPARDRWLVCTVVDAERGTTGIREAVVTAELIEAGHLTLETYEESWARDPYDPDYRGVDRTLLRYLSDDERYDSRFPEHPLSHVRRTLDMLLENVFLE